MATINMNVSGPFPSLCSDDSIGPVLQNPACRDHGFDFTLLFEETAFAIIPAVLLLCAAPLRFRSIYRRPDAVRWPPLCRIKLANIAILGLLDLTLLALWALPRYAALRTRTTIAATALDLAAVIVIGGLSPLEHSKSLRPSTILSVYLFFTTILDVARARTEWLLSTSSAIPAVFTTALAAKVSLLVLEGMTKAGHTDRIISPETTSSIYGLSSFAWLNPLIYLGSKTNLTEQSLYPIDDKISSKLIQAKLNKQWKSVSKQSENALAWAILRALRIPIAVTMIPRLALIGFSIAQPFLIQRAIVFVEVGTTPVRYGYGLIGAFGVTYLGIAVSTAWYEYLTARALAMIRASLIGIIYQSTLDMTTEAVQTASPVSLMGADVERVIARLRWVISTAPNILQVAIAIWLLGTHLGPVCIAPVLVVLILAYLSSKVGKTIRPRQQRWMQAVRKRVAMTTDVLGTTKGMKMLGFTTLITDLVQSARHYELDESKKFRSVQIVNITLGNAANMLSPVVTLIGYGIIVHYSSDKVPTATTIFSSLSLLSILMGPVDELVAAVPNLAMALESCTRIQQYVDVKKRLDFRTASLERADRRVESHLRPSASGRDTIHIEAVTAGWSTDKTVIHDLTIQMSAGTLTIVVGPSGSGKSTLLQVLLGEGIVQNGTVALTSHDIAYCDQTPFLTNRSIRDNVVGFRDFDEAWYHACLSACAIDTDIEHLLHGDETLVGSKGVALSGGQKQRLALARAVYARQKIVLLDDCLSGLDLETEQHCFHQLLGKQGLLKKTGATVVFVTHSVKWLPYSDQVVALNSQGRLDQVGSFKEVVALPGYVQSLNIPDRIASSSKSTAKDTTRSQNANPAADTPTAKRPAPAMAVDRGRRDAQNMLYYANTMGKKRLLLFLSLVAVQIGFTTVQPLWLSWWVDADAKTPHANYAKWLGVYGLFGLSAVTFLGISGGYYLIKLIPTSASALHYSVLKSVMSATMTFLSSTDSGDLLNRFTQDMTSMDMELPMALLIFTGSFCNTIGGAILTSVSSGYMAVCLPVLGLALFYLQKFYLRTSRQMRLLELEAKSPLYTHLTETIDGLHTIRAFRWQQDFLDQNFRLLDLAQRPFYLLLSLQNWLNLALDLAVLCLALVLIVLVVTLRDSMNSSLLGVALVSLVSFSQTMSNFVRQWASLETALGAVARTRQFIRDTPVDTNETGFDVPQDWPRQTSIEFEGVSAAYSTTGPDVLKDINLKIRPGERVAICGRTGSGKSTLAALVVRLLDTRVGSVSVGEHTVSQFPPDTIRGRINSLPQDAWFLPGDAATVRANLDPLHEATDEQIQLALEKTGLSEQVDSMGGLDSVMRGSQLSVGQRQLMCLARAMVMKRKRILLLDEATSSVDIHTEEKMMELLRTEFRGWTVVAIVHRLKSVVDFDRVVVLDAGRIIENDSPQQLLADESSAFAKLFRHTR